MRRWSISVAVMTLALLPLGRVAAQPEPQAQSAPAGQQADSAWLLYSRAFEAHLAGRTDEAREILARVEREFPGHPAAQRAHAALQVLGEAVPSLAAATPRELGTLLRDEKPTALARAELAVLQTFGGVAAGFELCGALECEDPRALISAAIVGGGAGLGLSLGLTRGGITPGHTLAINSGAGWGFWNGIALLNIIEPERQGTFALMLGGQLLGTGAGLLAYRLFEPAAGDVSLSNSTGIWSGVLAALINAAVARDGEPSIEVLLAASDLGLIAGGFLTKVSPMSRGRALLLDASGLLGMLLGFGVDVLIEGGEGSSRAFLLSGAAGTVAGLGAGYWLTRGWDLPDAPEAHLSLLPVRGGAAATLGFVF